MSGSNVQGFFVNNDKIKGTNIQTITSDIFDHISNVMEQKTLFKSKKPKHICPILRKIKGPTKPHIDGILQDVHNPYIKNNIRIFSVIIALNSDYEGGELCFPNQNFKIKLKAGEAIIFPPYWTHPHYTNDVNGTSRYTITMWLNN